MPCSDIVGIRHAWGVRHTCRQSTQIHFKNASNVGLFHLVLVLSYCFVFCLFALTFVFVFFEREEYKFGCVGRWEGSGRSWRIGKTWSKYIIWKKNFKVKNIFFKKNQAYMGPNIEIRKILKTMMNDKINRLNKKSKVEKNWVENCTLLVPSINAQNHQNNV